jgi:hypothetical protein
VEWSPQFYAWRAGDGCPSCAEGRPAATRSGVRYFSGELCDAYLVRADIQRGLTIAVFRGRHVAEPTELSDAEADPDPPAMPDARLEADLAELRRALGVSPA